MVLSGQTLILRGFGTQREIAVLVKPDAAFTHRQVTQSIGSDNRLRQNE
jgi:hypothetical protein